MRVFMLGWEFPPFISGGLGTACYGLTKALSSLGVGITFALPKAVKDTLSSHVKILTPKDAEFSAVKSKEKTRVHFDFSKVFHAKLLVKFSKSHSTNQS